MITRLKILLVGIIILFVKICLTYGFKLNFHEK